MPANMLKTEADLRIAVIDRLIAASLSDGKPAREATIGALARARQKAGPPKGRETADAPLTPAAGIRDSPYGDRGCTGIVGAAAGWPTPAQF